MSKKEIFESYAARIASGELSKEQAAAFVKDETGYAESTFKVWLSSSDNKFKIPDKRATAKNDPVKAKAYEDAVNAVLSGQKGAYAAKKFGVNYQYMMRMVRERQVSQSPSVVPTSEYLNNILQNPIKAERLAHLAKAMGL